MTASQALAAWGAYDRDDPFPLFAEVRELGAVHEVTLVDGHRAWLVVRYDEARAALNDPRLSKDMHAALATGADLVAEGLPGPAFARHMLSVDPPDHTRLRRLVSAAFSVRRVEALRPRVQTIVDDLLDDLAAARTRQPRSIWSRRSPSRCRSRSSASCSACPSPTGLAGSAASPRCSSRHRRPAQYARAKEASDAVVAMLGALVEAKQAAPGDDLVSGLISARDGDERLDSQELLSTIFQLIVAGHDTTTSLIGNSVVALLRNPAQLAQLRVGPRPDRGSGRGAPALRRTGPPLDVPLRDRAGRDRRRDDPGRGAGHHLPGGRQPGRGPVRRARSRSTSTGPRLVTSRSATASTSASARRWPAWRASSPSDRCCAASRSSASPSRSTTCTGATATASCCAACPSCPSSPAPRFRLTRSVLLAASGQRRGDERGERRQQRQDTKRAADHAGLGEHE